MELRNFFDDHREEMMSLIKENSQELFPKVDKDLKAEGPRIYKVNERTSNQPRPDLLTSEAAWRQQSSDRQGQRRGSCESSTDAEYERRRMEFAKRRIQKTRKKQGLDSVEKIWLAFFLA